MRAKPRTCPTTRHAGHGRWFPAAFRPLIPVALISGWALLSLASAGVPADAFGYSSAETDIASAQLERAEANLQRQRLGLSAGVDIDPGLSYGGALDDPRVDPSLDLDLSVGIDVAYAYDLDNIIGAEIDLAKAQQSLRDKQRSDVTSTLFIHADLLRAQLDLAEDEDTLASAQAALAEVEASHLQGAASDAQLERARYAIESAQLKVEISSREITKLREQANARGIGGEAVYAPLQFVLPEVEVEATFGYRLRHLDLSRQQARAQEKGLFGVIEDVNIFGGYEGTAAKLSGRVGLRRGIPGATVSFDYRDDNEDDWTIGISATIHVDDKTITDFADGERDIREAEEALRAYLERHPSDVLQARLAVEDSLLRLELSSRLAEINRAREAELDTTIAGLEADLAAIEERISALGQRRETADRDEQDDLNQQTRDLNGQLGDVERALRDANRELERSASRRTAEQNDIYRAWRDYVKSVDSYLKLVDASWESAL